MATVATVATVATMATPLARPRKKNSEVGRVVDSQRPRPTFHFLVAMAAMAAMAGPWPGHGRAMAGAWPGHGRGIHASSHV